MGDSIELSNENLFQTKLKSLGSQRLLKNYEAVRRTSLRLCDGLEVEDFVVQPTPEVSPPKWHLAHTTWFFEELILCKHVPDYRRYDEGFALLFNSYYKSLGKHWLQGERGQLSRPSVRGVLAYRQYVDKAMSELILSWQMEPEVLNLIEVGLNHEQQHQELLLMDIKYILALNPSPPKLQIKESISIDRDIWLELPEGVYEIGHSGESFSYDNERPRHKSYIHRFSIRKNMISNKEYLEFIENGGYESSEYWLSDGWDWINDFSIKAPLYWKKINSQWCEYKLNGMELLDLNSPVRHISYYEAYAFAKWRGARLPSESEYELIFGEDKSDLWCWTHSAYQAYPGFRPMNGVLGEYNGKFMCNQQVLRGGSFATPDGHYRGSYRNFFRAHQRWMFSGIRIARDI